MEDSAFSTLSNLQDIVEGKNNKTKINVNDNFFFKFDLLNILL